MEAQGKEKFSEWSMKKKEEKKERRRREQEISQKKVLYLVSTYVHRHFHQPYNARIMYIQLKFICFFPTG